MAGSTGDAVPWRRLRQSRGMTQQDVADALAQLAWTHESRRIGANADMVSKWERGEKSPSPFYRRLLGLLFDAPATVLAPRGQGLGASTGLAEGSVSVDHQLQGY